MASPDTALRRSIDVLISLTISDLKVRYGRGGWRLVKWMVDPFALVGVYLVLVTLVLDRRGGSRAEPRLRGRAVPARSRRRSSTR